VGTRRPSRHLPVHPGTPALTIDDTHALANGVENQIGLLGNQGPFKRKKVAGFRKNTVKMFATQVLYGLFQSRDLNHISAAFERGDQWTLGPGRSTKQQYSRLGLHGANRTAFRISFSRPHAAELLSDRNVF
jgi:hypothetical protein